MAHFSGDGTAGGALNVRVAGMIEATNSSVGAAEAGDQSLDVGARTVLGANPANARFMAAYFGHGLSADQRTHLRALLTYHTGVSC